MKTRYFVGVVAVALAVCGWQIAVHRHYVQTQTAAITAQDQAGLDPSATEVAVNTYVHTHMLTSTSVFLKASYDRAVAASQSTATESNGQVYAAAQAACASHADSIVQANCVQAYLSAHSTTGANPQAPAPAPAKADYTKTFIAPNWTEDSAGIALLLALVALFLAVYSRLLKSWR